jgi:glycosyltransferase involved in cell wall biosynthesis
VQPNASRPRVLLAHNHYRHRGGEDAVFAAEKWLLEKRGHEVVEYVETNDRLARVHGPVAASMAAWSATTYRNLTAVLERERPHVVHFHNTFAMISPSGYYACADRGIPVIQTLHNYRLMCPVATLFRRGAVCEDCLGRRLAWPGIVHGCYHGSKLQTAAVAGVHTLHSIIGTWSSKVTAYIALSNFSRSKFIEGGLPSEKIFVKPNFAIGAEAAARVEHEDYALFVGRLSEEKGLSTLLQAWRSLAGIRLKIAGDGPEREQVEEAVAAGGMVDYVGFQDARAVHDLMAKARCLIVPSLWYEGFPLVLAEGYAAGVCVVGSRIGALEELVADGRTGVLFTPGDSRDLGGKVRWLWDHPEEAQRMGANARREYEEKYTPERNYEMLIDIYKRAIEMNRQ